MKGEQAPQEVRHSLRPLSVYSFCGWPIAESRGGYFESSKDLPLCGECKRARDRAWQMRGGNSRLALEAQ